MAIATSILRIVAACCSSRVEPDALELGDPVDDLRHLGAEVALDVGERDLGVLDRVVQQRGGDEMSSRPMSATIVATAIGWLM